MLKMLSLIGAFSFFALLVAQVAIPILPVLAAETAQSLDARIAWIMPRREEERWLTVPWRTNVMQARLEAQNLRRPLFLWVMNGNPLGCT